MKPRDLLVGFGGVIVGAVGMYFILDRIHEKELIEAYAEIDALDADMKSIVDVEDATKLEQAGVVVPLKREVEVGEEIEEDEDLPKPEDFADEDRSDHLRLVEEYAAPTDEQDDPAPALIEIISPEEVSGRQVVCVYNHDDGSVEIDRTLSAKMDEAESLDDRIENDTLYSLIADDAYDMLTNSEELPLGVTRVVCVRNNHLNLDFVIRY